MVFQRDRTRWSDGELLAAIAACDEHAFSAFYRRYLGVVVGWYVRRTGDPELAADLTAEVFAAVLLAAGRYQPDHESAKGWLLGVARNVLGHSVRRGRVDARARASIGATATVIEEDDLAAVLELADSQAAADELLAGLSADEQEAVRARVLEEREYGQIARSLGCSEMVIRKRVSRGLGKLRTRLAQG